MNANAVLEAAWDNFLVALSDAKMQQGLVAMVEDSIARKYPDGGAPPELSPLSDDFRALSVTREMLQNVMQDLP